MSFDVHAIYYGSDGEATLRLYDRLRDIGPVGVVALNLMRACKASERAKKYRGGNAKGSYRAMAYDKKQWSMDNLCRELVAHGEALGLEWGWGVDQVLERAGDPHVHVLYVEIPSGQVSFHTDRRGDGPDYGKGWDGVRHASSTRICNWTATLLTQAVAA